MILGGLKAETLYSVSVAAYTTKGDGAHSKAKLVQTSGMGKYIHFTYTSHHSKHNQINNNFEMNLIFSLFLFWFAVPASPSLWARLGSIWFVSSFAVGSTTGPFGVWQRKHPTRNTRLPPAVWSEEYLPKHYSRFHTTGEKLYCQ